MRSSTRFRRASARSGFRNGESALGAWIRPASSAGLGRGQLGGTLAEVEARRAAHAVDGASTVLPQVDLVEIGLEDLGLRITKLDPERDRHLAGLAGPGPFGRQVDVLDELLGQRAAALGDPALPPVLERGARDADRGRCPDASGSAGPRWRARLPAGSRELRRAPPAPGPRPPRRRACPPPPARGTRSRRRLRRRLRARSPGPGRRRPSPGRPGPHRPGSGTGAGPPSTCSQ